MPLPIPAEVRRLTRLAALRFSGWPRRLLAAGCLVLAGLSALAAAKPAAVSVQVVVAAHDLPAGQRLRASDVRLAKWPRGTPPNRVYRRPAEVLGRLPATPVSAGEALTSTRMVGAGLAVGLAAGTVVATVSLAQNAVASLLHPGDRVDLLRPVADDSTEPPAVVVGNVPVLAVIPANEDGQPSMLAVAVTAQQAIVLAGVAEVPLMVTLRAR